MNKKTIEQLQLEAETRYYGRLMDEIADSDEDSYGKSFYVE